MLRFISIRVSLGLHAEILARFLLCASDYKVPITVTEFCTNLYLCVSSLSTAKWQNIAGSKKIFKSL